MYQLVTDMMKIPTHRDYMQANWVKFTDDLNQVNIRAPVNLNQKKLDAMVQKLSYSIETITENCCPTVPAKLVNKNNPW